MSYNVRINLYANVSQANVFIVSLTKVGNEKWKNKRKDKFFNMMVTRGIPPLETVTKNSGIHVEHASFERQQSLSSPLRLRWLHSFLPENGGSLPLYPGQAMPYL